MKVLKKADEREDLAKECECSNCFALLLVMPGDVKTSSGHCMGETEVWHSFTCPECKRATNVSPWWKKR